MIDTVGREITVPDFTTVTMSFGTPRVYRVRTIPELQALKANPDAVPTTEREFSRTDRLFIRARRLRARRRRRRRSPRGCSIAPASRWRICRCSRPPGRPAEIELPLSPLAAGEYLIELNAEVKGAAPPRN